MTGINLVPTSFHDRCSHCGGKWKRIELSLDTRVELGIGELLVTRCEKCLGIIAFTYLPQEEKNEAEAAD